MRCAKRVDFAKIQPIIELVSGNLGLRSRVYIEVYKLSRVNVKVLSLSFYLICNSLMLFMGRLVPISSTWYNIDERTWLFNFYILT